jgi:hypothetical protein
MVRRLVTSAIAALLVAGAAQAQTDSTKAAAGNAPAEPGVRRGNLFSAITFGDSTLGAAWARLRGEAHERFPDLKLTPVPDLHITVVYIGGDWKPEDLDRIRAHALVVPTAPMRLTPEVVTLGRNHHVVVVELHPASTSWADSVGIAKQLLNQLGLKKPESYDSNLRAHVTLAQAAHNPPTPADSTALAGFLSWMREKVAGDPQMYTVTLGPTTRVVLLLAGAGAPARSADRPADAPEYITVEDFLARQRTSPSGK